MFKVRIAWKTGKVTATEIMGVRALFPEYAAQSVQRMKETLASTPWIELEPMTQEAIQELKARAEPRGVTVEILPE
jgi:hypothetical protein